MSKNQKNPQEVPQVKSFTKKQQLILSGKQHHDSSVTRNNDGTITFEKGLIPYEEFHEALNHLLSSDKTTTVHGKHEDFVLIKTKIRIRI